MSKTAILVKNLNKSYGTLKAVDSLDFQVEKAECFGFLGPNGAGKTTTMKIIYGKAEPDPGRDTVIDVFGFHPAKDALTIKALSGIVPQQDNLDSQLNVTDNLYIYSRFYGMSAREAKKRISELLDFMELQEKARARIGQLSGGMQRRLTIARALINRPRLLILDEPTTGLDPQVRHMIWNKLRELKEMGVTVLLTTHYMEEAFQICDRLIIMDKGRKILTGNPRRLMSENLEAFVMEIRGIEKERVAESPLIKEDSVRHEFYQGTLFVYSNDADKLSRFAEALKITDYHVRQANLEDLFLKVTGRSLNELQ
ncbi:MAG: ATP-binding cassette domain-containing protein [Firmicutes bacterium]|nr:ATP-binding cassette domain-containing protein [Bacillota bacterium]